MNYKFPLLVIFSENHQLEGVWFLKEGKKFHSGKCLVGEYEQYPKPFLISDKELKGASKIFSIEDWQDGNNECGYCGHKESDGD